MKSKTPTRSRRTSYEFKKIAVALDEWCARTGVTTANFLMLRPCQRVELLSEHMKKKWNYTDGLIPKERSFRDFFSRLKSDQVREVGILQEA
jgi:hypothetical protein